MVDQPDRNDHGHTADTAPARPAKPPTGGDTTLLPLSECISILMEELTRSRFISKRNLQAFIDTLRLPGRGRLVLTCSKGQPLEVDYYSGRTTVSINLD
jgi:hypothetical protein